MSKQGFVQLHRKIQEHWLYQEKRTFSRFEAWIDLILMASHKDNKFILGNELIEIERGQFITSVRKLEERWKWSNTKVRSFLKLLESDEMIRFKSDTRKTVITIVKYDLYHSNGNEKTSQEHHENDTGTSQKHTINNVNNVNNNNIPFSEIVNYLNEKAGKNFKHSTNKTKDVIRARWNEGHRLDDFKKVIDICVEKWAGKTFSNGKKGDEYLQPSTLFNGKFDERLNWSEEQSVSKPKKPADQIAHEKMLAELGLLK